MTKDFFHPGPTKGDSDLRLSEDESILVRNRLCIIATILAAGLLVIATGVILSVVLILVLEQPEPWAEVRLPTSLQPQSYTLALSSDLETMQVEGSVAITLYVSESTEYIILHFADMQIDDALTSVTGYASSQQLEVKSVFNYTENDYYVVQLSSELTAGESVVLFLSFSYTLRQDLAGFYNGSYIGQDGTKHVFASTQFEATDARKAFPCFDEPALKANFTISITHDSYYNATSNMPVSSLSSARKKDGKVTTTFETSVKMSTYLVAFVVSDLECTDSVTIDGRIEVSSNEVCGKKNETDF